MRWTDDEDIGIVADRAHNAGYPYAIVEEYDGCLCGFHGIAKTYRIALYTIAHGAYDYPDTEFAIMDTETGRLVSHVIPNDIWDFIADRRAESKHIAPRWAGRKDESIVPATFRDAALSKV